MIRLLMLVGLASGLATRAFAADPAPVPLATQVQQLMASGDCQRALELSDQHLAGAPADPAALRFKGDAHRCLGQTREAVLAYRAHVAAGGTDAVVPQLLERLEGKLAKVRVAATGIDWTSPPNMVLVMGEERLQPGTFSQDDGIVFRDLPSGVAGRIELSGPGYATSSWDVGTLTQGTERKVTVAAEFVGFGTLELGALPAGVTVSIETGGQTLQPTQAGPLKLTAGEAKVTIKTSFGTVARTVALGKGVKVPIDPGALAPGQVTLRSVPAGSTVSYKGTQAEAQGTLVIPWEEGELDRSVGLNIVPSVPLGGLVTGPYLYTVDHRLLGAASGEFFAVGGEVSAHTLDWAGMPGVVDTQDAYRAFQAQLAGGGRDRNRTLAIGAGAGAAVLVGGGAYGLARAVDGSRRYDALGGQYDSALSVGDLDTAQKLYEDMESARQVSGRGKVLGVAGIGLGCGAAVVSWSFGNKARTTASARPVWDPKTLVLPSSGAAAPASSAPGGQ